MRAASQLSAFDAVISGLDELQRKAECMDLVCALSEHPLIVGSKSGWTIVSTCFASALGYTRSELENMSSSDMIASVSGESVEYRAKDGRSVSVSWVWSEPNNYGLQVATGKFVGGS